MHNYCQHEDAQFDSGVDVGKGGGGLPLVLSTIASGSVTTGTKKTWNPSLKYITTNMDQSVAKR